jgi:hypothetical protein
MATRTLNREINWAESLAEIVRQSGNGDRIVVLTDAQKQLAFRALVQAKKFSTQVRTQAENEQARHKWDTTK